MKLKKLNTDHYVIVDDSEIKEGDWYYWEITKTIQIAKLDSLNRLPKNSDGSKKITHSTQPNKGMENVTFISPREIKELIGEVDVEKRAKNHLDEQHNNEDIAHPELYDAYHSFLKGYNQGLEDNKEKKYTEEDIRKAIEFGHTSYTPFADVHYSNFIQSLQPKTEWEVEFINGKLKLK